MTPKISNPLFPAILLLFLVTTSCKSTKKVVKKKAGIVSKIVQSFKAIPKYPTLVTIETDTFSAPKGGHIQGIQQLDKQHLVISGSSNDRAYFFVSRMKGIARVKKRGVIANVVYINEDFKGMFHNHASGFQIENNLLAIGTEGGKDTLKSSVVFYDLTNPKKPRALGIKIDRQQDTAGAIGLTTIKDTFLLAVGGWDSDRIDFYLANTQTIADPAINFQLIKTWRTANKNTEDWSDPNWGTYQSINFLKDPSENLFLIGFYQNDLGAMVADIFEVDLQNAPDKLLKKVDSKTLIFTEGVSFKNGAGISTLSSPRRFNLLATQRNWSSVIKVNYW